MPQVKCKICSTGFYAKPHWLLHGWGKYCSMDCKRQAQKTGVFTSCFLCGKKVYRTQKALRVSKSKKYFCDKSCQTKWRNSVFVGEKHANWKNGGSMYRAILTRNGLPKICKLCRTKDTRILAVHHIDHNHGNNVLSNLAWLCHNCHFLVHHDEKERKKFMVSIA